MPPKHPHERGEDELYEYDSLCDRETPPRAWGRLQRVRARTLGERNTPTSVGKTPDTVLLRSLIWKHPHERGEDRGHRRPAGLYRETPPRAWGRPGRGHRRRARRRNTPTSVGKTPRAVRAASLQEKHPHERGEDFVPDIPPARQAETPPRAWGRLCHSRQNVTFLGNTPTSVGKTASRLHFQTADGKHPHERGEDPRQRPGPTDGPETPPRAWGRRCGGRGWASMYGNTPTSVGKTL